MYECMYEHTDNYLLSKVLFKYERKLVGTSGRVLVSTYVCMYVCMYVSMHICMYIDDCVRYIVP